MAKDKELIFSFTITDAITLKKCVNVFKKMLEPIPFKITAHGITMSQYVSSMYVDCPVPRDKLLEFYFNHKEASNKDHRSGDIIETSHIFSLDLASMRININSVKKADHIQIYQYVGDSIIHINIRRDGYPEKCSSELDSITTNTEMFNSSDINTNSAPICTLSTSLFADFIKKLTKNRISKCPMECYPEGFQILASSHKRVATRYTQGNCVKEQLLFTRELDGLNISALQEMCAITPSGLTKIFIEQEKIIRISSTVSFLGTMNIFILPPKNEMVYTEAQSPVKKGKGEKQVFVDLDSEEEEYSEEDDD